MTAFKFLTSMNSYLCQLMLSCVNCLHFNISTLYCPQNLWKVQTRQGTKQLVHKGKFKEGGAHLVVTTLGETLLLLSCHQTPTHLLPATGHADDCSQQHYLNTFFMDTQSTLTVYCQQDQSTTTVDGNQVDSLHSQQFMGKVIQNIVICPLTITKLHVQYMHLYLLCTPDNTHIIYFDKLATLSQSLSVGVQPSPTVY